MAVVKDNLKEVYRDFLQKETAFLQSSLGPLTHEQQRICVGGLKIAITTISVSAL